jgi:hypothetical protein
MDDIVHERELISKRRRNIMFKAIATKIAAPFVTGVAAIALTVGSASAASSLTANSTVSVGMGGSATVTGTATCGTDYTGGITVQLQEYNGGPNGASNNGASSATVVCDNNPHTWSAVVPVGEFGPFTHGGTGFVIAQMPSTTGETNNLNALTDQHGVTFQ